MFRNSVRNAFAAVLLVVALLSAIGGQPAFAVGTTYYVDCFGGKDNHSGTSAAAAWKSLHRASTANLTAGDQLLFKRGCTWIGTLYAKWQGTVAAPIVIDAYGTGALPIIQGAYEADVRISGSYQIIQHLNTLHAEADYDPALNCQNQPVGWKAGFYFGPAAHDNTLQDSQASGHSIGVGFADGARHNRVLRNLITDNFGVYLMQPGNEIGGTGVLLHGDRNEIGWNTFRHNQVRCVLDASGAIDDVPEGISIELYNATNSSIHHNTALGDQVFSELGSSAIQSSNNTYAYNLHVTTAVDARFIVTRGPGVAFGPVWGTILLNNTVNLTGPGSQGVTCDECSPSLLTMKNNIVVATSKALYVNRDGRLVESNNLFWPSQGESMPPNFLQNVTIDTTSRVADPQFVNSSAGDVHIQTTSPAIDHGADDTVIDGYATDIDGQSVPQAGQVDIGADESTASNPATMTSVAEDDFDRTATAGWGTADAGGSYALVGSPSMFSVGNSVGAMQLPGAGSYAQARLLSASIQDVDVATRVRMDKGATGGSDIVTIVARHVGRDTEYRFKVRFTPDGSVLVRTSHADGGAVSNGSEIRVPGVTFSPNSWLWIRVQATGTYPTRLCIRVWADGQTEPTSWTLTETDNTASLQAAGSIGLGAFISASSNQGTTRFDFDSVLVIAAPLP